jgi:ATP-dependent Clp protease ATP-binding subunit ClpC
VPLLNLYLKQRHFDEMEAGLHMTGEPLAATPRFQRVLGTASEIARSMGHTYLGVEHLFLAILRDPDAVPTQALAEVADTGEAERHLLAIMSSASYSAPSTAVHRPSGSGEDGTGTGPGGPLR